MRHVQRGTNVPEGLLKGEEKTQGREKRGVVPSKQHPPQIDQLAPREIVYPPFTSLETRTLFCPACEEVILKKTYNGINLPSTRKGLELPKSHVSGTEASRLIQPRASVFKMKK